jgi:hypothetical protein
LMNEQAMHLMNCSSSHTVRLKFKVNLVPKIRLQHVTKVHLNIKCASYTCVRVEQKVLGDFKKFCRLIRLLSNIILYAPPVHTTQFWAGISIIDRTLIYRLVLILVSRNLAICTYVCWI